MSYKKWFDPESQLTDPVPVEQARGDRGAARYKYTDEIILAVNVALATRRPLLVSGPSGGGKSSLAADVARVLQWEFDEVTITSRMQPGDLLYTVDDLKRLRDAQPGRLMDESLRSYIRPGILWKAFDPQSATQVAASATPLAVNRDQVEPPRPNQGIVVLLDEMDKAEPDVPNDLLKPLGSYLFLVPELHDAEVRATRVPLIVLTTNNERRLPDAFIRRCVDLQVKPPADATALADIGRRHLTANAAAYQTANPEVQDLLLEVAQVVMEGAGTGGNPVSIAEYLDTVRAVTSLNIPGSDWKALRDYTVRKPGNPRAGNE